MQHEEPPAVWEDGLLDSRLEAQLTQSIRDARRPNLPRVSDGFVSERPGPSQVIAWENHNSTLTQLIAGCGIAAVDGYLAMRDYAAAKGLDLVEIHHKGIDLQDLISTLVIDVRKQTEAEEKEAGARRFKR